MGQLQVIMALKRTAEAWDLAIFYEDANFPEGQRERGYMADNLSFWRGGGQ